MNWHLIAQKISFPTRKQNRSTKGGPSRIILTTSEFFEAQSRGITHLYLDFSNRSVKQALPFDVGSDIAKTTQGNFGIVGKACVSVTLEARASEITNLSDDDLGWMAEVLAPICLEFDIPAHAKPFVGMEAGMIADVNAPQRMQLAEWNSFNGICGIQHVPGVTRWDPGRFNSEVFLRMLKNLGVPNVDGSIEPVVVAPVEVEPELVEAAPVEVAVKANTGMADLADVFTTEAKVYDNTQVAAPVLMSPLPVFRGSNPLKAGSKAKAVSSWQEALGISVTGVHDAASIEKTQAIQAFFGLPTTGQIDKETWNMMRDL